MGKPGILANRLTPTIEMGIIRGVGSGLQLYSSLEQGPWPRGWVWVVKRSSTWAGLDPAWR
jgi:hypothetical protein